MHFSNVSVALSSRWQAQCIYLWFHCTIAVSSCNFLTSKDVSLLRCTLRLPRLVLRYHFPFPNWNQKFNKNNLEIFQNLHSQLSPPFWRGNAGPLTQFVEELQITSMFKRKLNLKYVSFLSTTSKNCW